MRLPSQYEAGVGEGEAGQEQVHSDFVCTKVTLHAKDTEAQGSEGPLPGCVMPMTLPLLAVLAQGQGQEMPCRGQSYGLWTVLLVKVECCLRPEQPTDEGELTRKEKAQKGHRCKGPDDLLLS